jgi:hypothetical protein
MYLRNVYIHNVYMYIRICNIKKINIKVTSPDLDIVNLNFIKSIMINS